GCEGREPLGEHRLRTLIAQVLQRLALDIRILGADLDEALGRETRKLARDVGIGCVSHEAVVPWKRSSTGEAHSPSSSATLPQTPAKSASDVVTRRDTESSVASR